ncbi:Early nodulin-like protein 1 [Linum grandiflorum]
MARLFSILSLMFLVMAVSEAREILVGGKESKTFWKVPGGNLTNLDYWAEPLRFSPGDVLVWSLEAKQGSVLQVKKDAYESCDKTNPIKEVKDGDEKVTLDRSGPFYFISGEESKCNNGLKLEVVVLSDHHHRRELNFPPSPAPSPASSSASKLLNYGCVTVLVAAAVSLLV